ncbi:hypothetical protein HHK36_009229 [Tetracentron sinense]|uniref:protein-serine/threonine phosphatase n=1 Tax=Tetracentron sinense TaxID=13715 RepID=A0A834ZIJ8_TETSI|nr:hypothetical protein HHK36_009229 [Tetracentron sinense]
MVDIDEFLWSFSIISFVVDFLHFVRKAILYMALSCNSPSSSSPLSWMRLSSRVLLPKNKTLDSENHSSENSCYGKQKADIVAPDSPALVSKGLLKDSQEDSPYRMYQKRNSPQDDLYSKRIQLEDRCSGPHGLIQNEICAESKGYLEENSGILKTEGLHSMATEKIGGVKVSSKVRMRPARIVIPEAYRPPDLDFYEVSREMGKKEFKVEGRDFFLVSKKGRREVMEDDYGAITDILGNPKQAFFAVFDGHGGRAAVDYVAENLGKNIIKAIGDSGTTEDDLQQAIRGGYLTTDKEFLSQGVRSGACAATVLLKDGELHVANVGDCRVVLSRNGKADALTYDHRPSRDDERYRIESSGGSVNCCHGILRVQGTLAVSRAIGDLDWKEWIISEPETRKLHLTPDCEFLIIASDGLWDKVTNQEAVDELLIHEKSIESCKKLVDMSSSRGNRDDITVMVVNLQNFAAEWQKCK